MLGLSAQSGGTIGGPWGVCFSLTLGLTATAWCLRNEGVSSVLLGASNADQLMENIGAIQVSVRGLAGQSAHPSLSPVQCILPGSSCMPGSVLGTQDASRTHQSSAPGELAFQQEQT